MTQGFVSGALINVPLNDKLGFGRVSFRMFSVDDTTSDNVSGSLSRLSQLVRSIDRQLAHNPPPILGALCQVIGYAIQVPGPPFPAFVFAFVINGVGIALQVSGRYFYSTTTYMGIQDAQANGFVATLKANPEAKMGILHAAYGRPFCIWENPLNSRGCDGRCRSACRPPGRYPVRTTSPVVIPLYDFSWTCHSKHYRPRGRLPP